MKIILASMLIVFGGKTAVADDLIGTTVICELKDAESSCPVSVVYTACGKGGERSLAKIENGIFDT